MYLNTEITTLKAHTQHLHIYRCAETSQIPLVSTFKVLFTSEFYGYVHTWKAPHGAWKALHGAEQLAACCLFFLPRPQPNLSQ